MKHFLSFCFALCSIVLAALHLTPTFAGDSVKYPQEQKIKAFTVASTEQVVTTPISFSPGSLPERISVPKPSILKDLHAVNNENGMDLENLKLNSLLYKDLEPDNSI